MSAPLHDWRDKADIPKQAGYLLIVLKDQPKLEAVRAVVVVSPAGHHWLETLNKEPINFSQVIGWKPKW